MFCSHKINEKQSVALISIIASFVTILIKLSVWFGTNSLSVLSETAHSLLDFIATVLTYCAVKISDQPADEHHHYGHGKIESLSAFVQTILLFIASFVIVKESIERLIFSETHVKATYYAVIVFTLCMVIDLWRFKALKQVAKKTHSQALAADALHFGSDMLGSAAVLIGLAFTFFGFKQADSIAAICVACVIFSAGYKLAKHILLTLTDAAPDGIKNEILLLANNIPEIIKIDSVRVRTVGGTFLIELLIRINRTASLEQAENICKRFSNILKERYSNSDVFIRTEPIALSNETISDTIKIISINANIPIHHLDLHKINDNWHIAFDIEVADNLTIEEAHKKAHELENKIKLELGENIILDIHIDVSSTHVLHGNAIDDATYKKMKQTISEITENIKEILEIRKFNAYKRKCDSNLKCDLCEGVYLLINCAFKNSTPVFQVHKATHKIEYMTMEKIKNVKRVTVHAEPE